MIRKLRIKFILLSMISLALLLAAIVSGMNVMSYSALVNEADSVLALLKENKGDFPKKENGARPPDDHAFLLPEGQTDGFSPDLDKGLPPDMSPETPYESRFFSVLLDRDGNIVRADVSRIAAVDLSSAESYAKRAAENERDSAFVGSFRYAKKIEGDLVRITFLDCGRRLDAFFSFLRSSVVMSFIGLALVFFVIFFFAGRIIRPIAESYGKQKRFITDAGHELKTPLTVISANADLLEMEVGKNECIDDIKQQTALLSSLTADLVMLARMEEPELPSLMVEFPLSEVVSDAAASFSNLAVAGNKVLNVDIEPMLSINGNADSVRKLTSILLDNAIKYSPPHSEISVTLERRVRSVRLTVQNVATVPPGEDDLPHIFDRFFRADPSRNSTAGGHGIGLSVAKAIVQAHEGRICAFTGEGGVFAVTVTLPA